jgi:hypothetical protein
VGEAIQNGVQRQEHEIVQERRAAEPPDEVDRSAAVDDLGGLAP